VLGLCIDQVGDIGGSGAILVQRGVGAPQINADDAADAPNQPAVSPQLCTALVGPVLSDDFHAAATPTRCFDKSAAVHGQKQRVQ
jgi:hypothetical protein